MSAREYVSAAARTLTDLRARFLNHPQHAQIALVAYVFLVAIFMLVATLAIEVAPSVATAYFIGFVAIGVSAFTLYRLNAVQSPSLSIPSVTLVSAPMIADELPEAVQDAVDLTSAANDDDADEDMRVLAAFAASRRGRNRQTDSAPVELQVVEPESPDESIDDNVEEPTIDQVLNPPKSQALVFRRSPVVTLPHRKVAIIRGELVAADGSIQDVSDEVRFAHAVAFATQHKAGAGRMVMIRLSPEGLDGGFLDEALDLIASMPDLADRIVFELPKEALLNNDPDFIETLAYAREHGVQFAARKETAFVLTDFITHAPVLSAFSFVMMPAKLILSVGEDIIKLLEPLGVKLIALDVDSDAQLVEILDFTVAFAAGPLFEAPAQPVAAQTKKRAAPRTSQAAGRARKAAAEPPKRPVRQPPRKTRIEKIQTQLAVEISEPKRAPAKRKAKTR